MKVKSNLVSIMMPVYNGLPLIRASIESIIRQTYSNWECIIVDDGSTDGTSSYLNSIQDERFKIYHLDKNSGRAVARQVALDKCRGKFICMVDAEDIIHPERISKQVDFLENNQDYSLVTSPICSFGTKTKILLVRGENNSGDVVFNGQNHPVHAASMYRANIAKKCTYNPILRLGEDQDFLEKYLKYNPKYYILDQILYYYSELDSVTKEKIRKNYYLYIGKYLKQRNYQLSFTYFLKYMYSLIVFPFISIESILRKRGREADNFERYDYNKYCKEIIDKYIQ